MFAKKDLENALVFHGKFSMADAERAVRIILNEISDELSKGGRVTLPRFGTFEVRQRAARNGVNPATGEKISIPARKAVAFRAGSELRSLINKP